MKSNRGAVLWELALFLPGIALVLFFSHLAVVRECLSQLEQLQRRRLPYTGEIRWKP